MFRDIIYTCLFIGTALAIALLFYNVIRLLYFIGMHRWHQTHTNYELKKIQYYQQKSKKTLVISILLISLSLGIFHPLKFKKLFSEHSQQAILTLELRGSLNKNHPFATDDPHKIQDLLSLLNEYQYIPAFNYNYYGGIGEFILLDSPEALTVIEVWATGYVRIPNDNIYRVLSPSRDELFNRLKSFID